MRIFHPLGGDCSHGAHGGITRHIHSCSPPSSRVRNFTILSLASNGSHDCCSVFCNRTSQLERLSGCARRYHQYKFIVDGEWRHDESQAYMPDPLGNVNNWLFIRKPEQHGAEQPQQQPLLGCVPPIRLTLKGQLTKLSDRLLVPTKNSAAHSSKTSNENLSNCMGRKIKH